MQSIKSKAWAWLAGLCLCWASATYAADLGELKAQGLVGERADGYLGLVVATASADAQQLVREINAKRNAEYQRIAAANSIPVERVEALAGQKAFEKTAPGDWVFVESWVEK